ncbi:MAG: hypothetical protein GOVbin4162_43 [Prokaryotic dsDNA virus sp.]|nr:MAG: hypothetical protein GOVbin4162_43 [Prokaryotic dsDNA virus sp.]|tara:strand:- start:2646 stop:2918 length:273 start_codon:yes stop_codon:yes gene_type:complete
MVSWLLFLIFALLQVADVRTTDKAILEGAIEANPVVRWVMDKLGDRWWLVKLLPLAGGVVLLAHQAWMALLVLNVIFGFVVWHNYKLGSK